MLETCCFMKLKTAGIVIAVLEIIISGFALTQIVPDLTKTNISENAKVFLTIIAVLLVLNLLFSILLVCGTLKESHLLLLPWLIFDVIFMVAQLMCNPLNSLLAVALEIYMYCAIYSLYAQFKEKNKRPVQYEAPTMQNVA